MWLCINICGIGFCLFTQSPLVWNRLYLDNDKANNEIQKSNDYRTYVEGSHQRGARAQRYGKNEGSYAFCLGGSKSDKDDGVLN